MKYLHTIAYMFLATSASASVVTQGPLTVDIRNDNAAIDAVTLNGNDFFNPGDPNSDFGLQLGTDGSTFRLNTTDSTADNIGFGAVTNSGGVISSTANYLGLVAVTRSYSIIPGVNVLRIDTSLTAGILNNIRIFDTFDPDQGSGSFTFNDVFSLGGGTVLEASGNGNTDTVVAGFIPVGGFSGGFGLSIGNSTELNNLFANGGADPNGAFADIGYAIADEFDLDPGQSATNTQLHAFGDSSAEARNDFLAALSIISTPSGVVPEPTSIIVWGLLGTVGLKRRRR